MIGLCFKPSSLALAVLLAAPTSTLGFTTTSTTSTTRIFRSKVAALYAEKNTKKLTPADIIAKAKERSDAEKASAPPKLFDDDLMEDMTNVLNILERRVKGGSAVLDATDLKTFEAASDRILTSVKEGPPADLKRGVTSGGGNAFVRDVREPAIVTSPVKDDESSDIKLEVDDIPPGGGEFLVETSPEVTAISEEDGPEYRDGRLGLAAGTANTYIIPGMDEMTPEEYRAALQKSVIDRQEERKKNRGGVVGNRASHQYLDSIGWGGFSESWQANEEKDKETKKVVDEKVVKAKSSKLKAASKKPVIPKPSVDEDLPAKTKSEIDDIPRKKEDPVKVQAAASIPTSPEVTDISDEEGPEYRDGGLGLAPGTANTYIIPGMDEMTPEEYRAALQKSVIDRQEERRKNRGGVVGNRASHQYLDSIGWGGFSESWQANEEKEEEE